MIRFTGYGVIAEKPRVGQLGPIFSVHPVGKLYVVSKNEIHLFWWPRWALSPRKVWGRSYNARAPAVGAKTWCLYVFTGRIAAKRQTAGIKFTRMPKIGFFDPQGRLVWPIHVKVGRADGHLGPLAALGRAKFHLNRRRGLGMRPKKYQKFPLKSRPAGATPLTDFEIFWRFYTPSYPTLAFQISCDLHHSLRSYCWETTRL